jgi:hypothetical protein
MAFIIYNPANSNGDKSITLDKFGRIYMSAGLRDDLGAKGVPFKAHLAYDPDTDTIGIARPGTVAGADNVEPITFDAKRSYASVRPFLHKHKLMPSETPIKYVFTERKNGWYSFRLAEKEGVKTGA